MPGRAGFTALFTIAALLFGAAGPVFPRPVMVRTCAVHDHPCETSVPAIRCCCVGSDPAGTQRALLPSPPSLVSADAAAAFFASQPVSRLQFSFHPGGAGRRVVALTILFENLRI